MTAGSSKLMPELCDRHQRLHYSTALNLLILAGIDLNNVRLLPVGEYENYKGEILDQEPKAGTALKADTLIRLKVGFPAAVDNLPYQFYYGLHAKQAVGAGWEEKARCLTAAFDSPEIRYNTMALRQMLKFQFAVPDQSQLNRFLDLFGLDMGNFDTLEEALSWAMLMPAFNEWAGNAEQVARILEKIFGYRFRIVENTRSEFAIPQDIRYRLGSKTGRLGKESIIGRSFIEFDSAFQVIVSGIDRDEINGFLPGGEKRKKVERIIRLCMPGNLEFGIIFETDRRTLNLGNKSYLGYSSRV